jgi:hypothetical protein
MVVDQHRVIPVNMTQTFGFQGLFQKLGNLLELTTAVGDTGMTTAVIGRNQQPEGYLAQIKNFFLICFNHHSGEDLASAGDLSPFDSLNFNETEAA